MLIRNIGKLLRGKVSPGQIILACVLGSMLGFMPGFWQAGGLIVLLVLLLVVLNANLFLAAAVGLIAKGLALLLLPVTFLAGRLLLDGPTGPLFGWAINTPVLALFGFEYYITTGGMLMGLVLGLLVGVGLARLVIGFRRRMAKVEEGSERYQQWMSRGWVKGLAWVFFGGQKKTYAELAEQRQRLPIRPIGALFAVLVVGLLIVLNLLLAEPIVTAVMHEQLERANGATVDLERVELDLGGGNLRIVGLAMADPNALATNLFEAMEMQADISAASLLTKRLAFDRIVFSDAATGTQRERPGRLVGRQPRPAPPPEDAEKTIEDYLEDARRWKDRLAQVKKWLEQITGTGDADPEEGPTLEERLRQRIAALGYDRVVAEHLIEGVPMLTIRELVAEKVRAVQLDGETLDIRGRNLSTHPYLLDEPSELTVESSGQTLSVVIRLAEWLGPNQSNRLAFAYRGLSGDRVGAMLRAGDVQPVRGGEIDLASEGLWRGGYVELPLNITLRNSTISVPGAGSRQVELMILPLGLRGPLDNPAIMIDNDALAQALIDAGAEQLVDEATDRIGQEVREKIGEKVGEELGEKVGEEGGKLLEGLFGNE